MALIRNSVETLKAYVPGEQPADLSTIKLNTNENPYPPSPRVTEALAKLDSSSLRRYPDPVCQRLREGIAALHACGPERVFVGNGSDEVLALCTRAFVEDGGAVGYFELSYSLYPVLADIRAVRRRPQKLGERFEWQMPETGGMDLFFLTNPNAPTGMQYPAADVRRFCESFEGVVVIDEAYVDFADEDNMDLALELENVLVARTFSKAYSLAGVRVGYAVGPPRLIEALGKIKDSYNVNVVSQRLALAALEDRAHMLANAARIRGTRERLCGALRRLGFEVFPSRTNFVWAAPPDGAAPVFFEELRRRRILVRFFPGRLTSGYLRITVGTDEEIDRLIAALETIRPGKTSGDIP